jgi:uncharacterized membrane protein YeaQ/YmgE (transglycosylase-associated protein family)
MISLLTWAVFGAIAGGVAKAILPGRLPAGWIPTIVLGCLGSVVGGLPFGQGSAGLVGSVVGSVVVIWFYSQLQEQKS